MTPWGRRVPDRTERRLAAGLLLFSLTWAVVVGSNLFQISSWIVGDIAYHRGVAYTMQGAAWQGEGPFVGLLATTAGSTRWPSAGWPGYSASRSTTS